jgi:spore coat protein YutH
MIKVQFLMPLPNFSYLEIRQVKTGGLTLIEQIFNEYGLVLEPVTFNGGQWLSSGDQLFCFVDQFYFHHPDLRELSFYCSQFKTRGHHQIAEIIPTKDGRFFTNYRGRSLVLLSFPKNQNGVQPSSESLAHFHTSGREIVKQIRQSNEFYPEWREYWTKRIDDLGVHWNEVERKQERTEYEELFLKVFPYFSGRAENAIQYVTDLSIDRQITDEPVICHHRFNGNSWGRNTLFTNTPDQWLVDHPARDLAEWLRTEILTENRPATEVFGIIDAYQSQNELSIPGLGLVFARLLYPIPFIENAEFVFDHKGEESQGLVGLKEMLNRVDDEERILAEFGKMYLKPLPRVDWLARKLKASL